MNKDQLIINKALKALKRMKITPEDCIGEKFDRCDMHSDTSVSVCDREVSVYIDDKIVVFDVNCYNGIDWTFTLFDILN